MEQNRKLWGNLYQEHNLCKEEIAKVLFGGRIYKKNIITIRFDERSKIEDADFNAALVSINENLKIMYTRVPLYFYFFRAGSLVSKTDGRVCMTLGERLYYINMH